MSRESAALLNHGFIGTGALLALAMLVGFYFVVSGAVTRASHRNAEWNNVTADAGSVSAGVKSSADRVARTRNVLLARAGV